MLLIGLLIGGAAGAGAMYVLKVRGKAGIPGGPRLGEAKELDLVPPDAAGFVHVRLRDVWHTEGFAEFRKLIEKAGPEALAELDEGFAPAPSTIDRLTVVFFRAPGERQPQAPPPVGKTQPKGPFPKLPPKPPPVIDTLLILTFTAPYSQDKVRDAYLKDAQSKKQGDKEYWVTAADPKGGGKAPTAVHFADDRTLVAGHPDAMVQFLGRKTGQPGPLSRPLKLAAEGGWHLVAAFNPAPYEFDLVETFRNDLQPDFAPALEKAGSIAARVHSVMVSASFAEETKVEFRAVFKDEAAAAEGEESLREFARITRERLAEPKKKMQDGLKRKDGQTGPRPLEELPGVVLSVFGLGAVNSLDEFLADPPLKRDGTDVVLTPRVPSFGVGSATASMAAVGMWFMMPRASDFKFEPPVVAPDPKEKAPKGKGAKGPPAPPPIKPIKP
jgi:hypothetical protein